LLPQPRRRCGRFRRYDADDAKRLRLIRRARQLGFTLDEVRALMYLADTDGDDVRPKRGALALRMWPRSARKLPIYKRWNAFFRTPSANAICDSSRDAR